MQTMTNNNLSFGAIKADKSARSLLAKRLDTAKKYLRFEDLKAWQRIEGYFEEDIERICRKRQIGCKSPKRWY